MKAFFLSRGDNWKRISLMIYLKSPINIRKNLGKQTHKLNLDLKHNQIKRPKKNAKFGDLYLLIIHHLLVYIKLVAVVINC